MSVGRHDERGAQTRRALFETALDLLIESGGGEIPSVKAVCARVGHTRGTFYSRFESREQFVTELLDWVLSDMVGTVFAAADADAGAAGIHEVVERLNTSLSFGDRPQVRHDLRAAYLAVMAALRTQTTTQERHASFMRNIIDRLAAGIREGQKAGDFRSDVDAHHASTILVLVSVSAILWSETDIATEINAVTEALLDLLVQAPED